MNVDWDKSRYFKATEFYCSHTGIGKKDQGFRNK